MLRGDKNGICKGQAASRKKSLEGSLTEKNKEIELLRKTLNQTKTRVASSKFPEHLRYNIQYAIYT